MNLNRAKIRETRHRLYGLSTLSTYTIILAIVLIAMAHTAFAQSIVVGKDQTEETQATKPLMLPYAFYYSNFGASVGFVYGGAGYPQRQATLLASVIAGSNDALAFYLLSRDVQVPFMKRLFVDTDLALSTFGTIQSYTSGNPAFPNERAGGNNSDKDNYVEGRGNDNFARVKFRYMLPIGHGRDQIINTLVMANGIPVKGTVGGDSWNPLTSGRTFLEFKPYWREQVIHADTGKIDRKTNGAEFSLFWENTDFPRNPSRGSSWRMRYNKDWGFFDSSNPYDVVDTEFSQYFSLGASERFRQRVIAFDFWTSNALSWDDYSVQQGKQVYHRPPAFSGSTLGGLWRMRAYPTSRFNDQAALYYALEYRVIPEWNPFANIEWVRTHLGIEWWQWVPFLEVGRVAPQWSIDTLHSSMKWDAGFGIRAMAKGIVIRIDMAGSNEGYGVNMMVGHPFQF